MARLGLAGPPAFGQVSGTCASVALLRDREVSGFIEVRPLRSVRHPSHWRTRMAAATRGLGVLGALRRLDWLGVGDFGAAHRAGEVALCLGAMLDAYDVGNRCKFRD